VISNRNRPELLSDKDTGLDSDAQYHCGSPADRPTSNGSCREQNTIATPHQQQPQDIDNTLSQNTSVGAVSSDEIEEFEDDNSW